MKPSTFTTFSSILLVGSSLIGGTVNPPTLPIPAPPTIGQIVAAEIAHLTMLLSLDSAQKASATTYFTTEETALVTLAPSMTKAQTDLNAGIEANNSADIAADTSKIGTITAEEALARATAEAEFYAILTPDQQTKYKLLLTGGYNAPAVP